VLVAIENGELDFDVLENGSTQAAE
jgi:hypothetical protein